jgi:molecular chaperone GrpE
MADEKKLNGNPAPPDSEGAPSVPEIGDAGPPAARPGSSREDDWAEAYRKLQAEKQELFDRLLRKQAELENIRKRLEREKQDFLQHATADLIRALLPTLDSLERALKHPDDGVPRHFYDGLDLIYRELLEVLGRAGVTVIPTQGKIFDPHVHQAVEMVESREHRDQEILEELQRGYKLRQRLLRPAVVKVATHPPQGGEGDPSEGR